MSPTEHTAAQNMALLTSESTCQAEHERMQALLEKYSVDSLARLSRQIESIPLKVQAYLALSAIGWSQRKVADLFGVRQQTVFDALSRWDPECIFRGNPNAVLAIRAAMAMHKGDEFLWSITEEEIAGMNAYRRVRAGLMLMDMALKLRDRVQA